MLNESVFSFALLKHCEKLHLGAGDEWPYSIAHATGNCSAQEGHLAPGGGCERRRGNTVKTLGL